MIRSFPSQVRNLSPPFRVVLVARHDNILHVKTSLGQEFVLYLANTPCKGRQRSETIFYRDVTTPIGKIVVADMDSNVLYDEKWPSEISVM